MKRLAILLLTLSLFSAVWAFAPVAVSDTIIVPDAALAVDAGLEDDDEAVVDHNAMAAEKLAAEMIKYGSKYIGLRYRRGGTTPQGFDCSGFTSYVYRKFGYNLVHQSAGQTKDSRALPKNMKAWQPGDLCFFNGRRAGGSSIGHVGIVTEIDTATNSFKFIHSSCTRGVVISDSREEYYARRFVTVRRVIPDFNKFQGSVEDDSLYIYNNVSEQKASVESTDTTKNTEVQTVPESEKKSEPQPVYYTVRKGDTLSSIARKYHTSVSAICRLSKINENKYLQIGQRLRVK